MPYPWESSDVAQTGVMRDQNEPRAAGIVKKHNALRRHYERSACAWLATGFDTASGVRSVPVRAYSSLRLRGCLAFASGPPLPHEIQSGCVSVELRRHGIRAKQRRLETARSCGHPKPPCVSTSAVPSRPRVGTKGCSCYSSVFSSAWASSAFGSSAGASSAGVA
jgi:hypothetical protein